MFFNEEKMRQDYHERGYITIDEAPSMATPSMFEKGEYVGGTPMPITSALKPRKRFYSTTVKKILDDPYYHSERVFTSGKIVECEPAMPASYLELVGRFFIFPYSAHGTITPRSENFVIESDDHRLPCTIGTHLIEGLYDIRTKLNRYKFYSGNPIIHDVSYTGKQLDIWLNSIKTKQYPVLLGGVNSAGRLLVDTIITPDKETYLFNLVAPAE
jgi:hypothetical protein